MTHPTWCLPQQRYRNNILSKSQLKIFSDTKDLYTGDEIGLQMFTDCHRQRKNTYNLFICFDSQVVEYDIHFDFKKKYFPGNVANVWNFRPRRNYFILLSQLSKPRRKIYIGQLLSDWINVFWLYLNQIEIKLSLFGIIGKSTSQWFFWHKMASLVYQSTTMST